MSKLWVNLGRTGDILGILPLLHHDAQTGERPRLMVAEEYAGVLGGCSYIDPVVWHGKYAELGAAIDNAKSCGDEVLCVQISGPTAEVREHTYKGQMEHSCTSFDQEPWRLAGRLNEWLRCYPLVFDRRSPEREAKLLADVGLVKPGRKKPLLLVAAKGTSSPFPYPDLLMELIRLRFGKEYHILEVPKAERVYDLLALYERAHCLVATDSAPLHLARACPDLPVIALTNDRPALWNGSSWQPNWAWCCRYHDFPERAVEMLGAINTCRDDAPLPFIHVWNAYESKSPSAARCYLPVHRGACGRDSGNTINDQKRIPYLKDCLRMAMQRATDSDHICLSRPEAKLVPPLHLGGEWPQSGHEACYANRVDHNAQGPTFMPVADLFCATKAFWKAHLAEVPDLLLGNDIYWPQALWAMFKQHGAVDVTGVCYRMAKEKA